MIDRCQELTVNKGVFEFQALKISYIVSNISIAIRKTKYKLIIKLTA